MVLADGAVGGLKGGGTLPLNLKLANLKVLGVQEKVKQIVGGSWLGEPVVVCSIFT